MTVSVIIPAYNAEETLPRALASIAAQTLSPQEIIVVDDGSTDGTWAYVQSLAGHYQNIPLISRQQDNAGAGAARNQGINLAKGAYLAFLDADDTWSPEKLAVSVAALAESKHAFVCHNLVRVEEDGSEHMLDCTRNFLREDCLSGGNPQIKLLFWGYLAISTMVIRADIMRQAGGFDAQHRYALDYEFWLSLFVRHPATTFTVLPQAMMQYYPTTGGLTANALPRLREREVYLKRYAYALGQYSPKPAWVVVIVGWLAAVYDAWTMAATRRQWGVLAQLVLRAPVAIVAVLWRSRQPYTRPHFLA